MEARLAASCPGHGQLAARCRGCSFSHAQQAREPESDHGRSRLVVRAAQAWQRRNSRTLPSTYPPAQPIAGVVPANAKTHKVAWTKREKGGESWCPTHNPLQRPRVSVVRPRRVLGHRVERVVVLRPRPREARQAHRGFAFGSPVRLSLASRAIEDGRVGKILGRGPFVVRTVRYRLAVGCERAETVSRLAWCWLSSSRPRGVARSWLHSLAMRPSRTPGYPEPCLAPRPRVF